jgi:20S proteasome subunit alpha 1
MAARSAGYDRHITIFSPQGRLYQVEYAFKAAKGPGVTAIAIRGKDSVVIVSQKKVPDALVDPSCITHLHAIAPKIGSVTCGLSPDSRAMVARAREEAAKYQNENGYQIPVSFLARQVANVSQVYTQHAYMRLFGVVMMFCSFDDELGPQLYKVDPSGHFVGYVAAAAGAKEQEGSNALEKIVKKELDLTKTETIQQAIMCLQDVLQMDLKSKDIEVGLVTKENPKFTKLTLTEIDDQLTQIAERD